MTDVQEFCAGLLDDVDPREHAACDLGRQIGVRLAASARFPGLRALDVQAFVERWLAGVDVFSAADLLAAIIDNFDLEA